MGKIVRESDGEFEGERVCGELREFVELDDTLEVDLDDLLSVGVEEEVRVRKEERDTVIEETTVRVKSALTVGAKVTLPDTLGRTFGSTQ